MNHPNFPAARRICNCIDALGGDVQACLPVVFECMWCKTIQCAEPVLLRVINEDIFNVSDTDDIPMLKKRLVNLQNYF